MCLVRLRPSRCFGKQIIIMITIILIIIIMIIMIMVIIIRINNNIIIIIGARAPGGRRAGMGKTGPGSFMCVYVCIYIYIYRERERDRQIDRYVCTKCERQGILQHIVFVHFNVDINIRNSLQALLVCCLKTSMLKSSNYKSPQYCASYPVFHRLLASTLKCKSATFCKPSLTIPWAGRHGGRVVINVISFITQIVEFHQFIIIASIIISSSSSNSNSSCSSSSSSSISSISSISVASLASVAFVAFVGGRGPACAGRRRPRAGRHGLQPHEQDDYTYSLVQCSVVSYSIVQYGMVQYGIV